MAVDEQDIPFGEGDLPRALKGTCWAAFLLPPLWALAYRLWGWFWLFIGMTLAFNGISITVNSGFFNAGNPPDPLFAGAVTLILSTVRLSVVLAFSRRAVPQLWDKASAQLKAHPIPAGQRPPMTVARFVDNQKTWTWVGAGLLVMSQYSGLVKSFAPPPWKAATFFVQLAVTLVMLALAFVYDRRRTTSHAVPGVSES